MTIFLPKDILSIIFTYQKNYKYFFDSNTVISLFKLNNKIRPKWYNGYPFFKGTTLIVLPITSRKRYEIQFKEFLDFYNKDALFIIALFEDSVIHENCTLSKEAHFSTDQIHWKRQSEMLYNLSM